MKKMILLLTGISILLVFSCRKSAQNESNDAVPNGAPGAPGARSYTDFLAQKSQATMMKKMATAESNVSGIQRVELNTQNTSRGGGLGCCRGLEEATSVLANVVDEPGCTDVTVTYHWTVYETVCVSPAVDYVFTVDPGYGTVYYGDGKLIDQYTVVINWYCCHPTQYYTVKTFSVDVVMPRSEFAASQSVNTVTGSNTCATNSITDTCQLSFDYCGSPAIASVTGFNLHDTVSVNGQCATSCSTPPHVQCPTGGTFYYRLSGSSGSWSGVSITGGYNLIPINVSSTTNYDYRISYSYGSPYSCTSPESTGTVAVNP